MHQNYYRTETSFRKKVDYLERTNNSFSYKIKNKKKDSFTEKQLLQLRDIYFDHLKPDLDHIADVLLWANKLYGNYNNAEERREFLLYYLPAIVFIENVRLLEKILDIKPYTFFAQEQVFEFFEIEGLVKR